MLGSAARQRERKRPDLLYTRIHTHIHFEPQLAKQMIDNHSHIAPATTTTATAITSSSPAPAGRPQLFNSSGPPSIHPLLDTTTLTERLQADSKAKITTLNLPTSSSLRRSPFSSTYLRRILSSLYSPASYLATALHNSAPAPPFDPTEPPLSPRSAALASAAAYPFTAAPAVYSVPFIINDQICIVPYVPLPRPAGYERERTTSRPSTPPSSSATFSPLSPTRSSPLHSPLSPPSPPSPALYDLLPEQSLQLGEQWLSVLSPASLSAHFHPNLYVKLLHTPTPYQSHITKDITRTFPTHPLFQQHKTRAMLYNILAAYSNYDHDIGYSQGMAFLVGFVLLHSLADECRVFWAFVSMMYRERWSLRSLYFDDCVSLKRLLLLTQRCLDERTELSALSAQLRALSLDVTLFATQWYVTVYSYRFEVGFSERVWTLFMDGGWRVLLCAALSVMEWLQVRVVGLSFEGVMGEVRGMEAVGVEVAERSTTLQLSAEVEKELEACKWSEKRVRSLKM